MQIPKLELLWQYSDYWARSIPDAVAMRFNGQVITFREVAETTDRLAMALLDSGVEKGDRIVTILSSRPEYVYCYIAASKIGAVTVPLDVRYKSAELRNFIGKTEPKVIVALARTPDNDIAEILNSLKNELGRIEYIMVDRAEFGTPFQAKLSLNLNQKLASQLKAAKEQQDPQDEILLIFTGGTTGVPKGALLSHGNIVTMCRQESQLFLDNAGVDEETGRLKILAALPPSHVGGSVEIMGLGIVGGGELILHEHWNPYQVLETTAKEGLSLLAGVPPMYVGFLRTAVQFCPESRLRQTPKRVAA